jgi:uncharacterized GH25 family protein
MLTNEVTRPLCRLNSLWPLICAGLFLSTMHASAHEFWIDPVAYAPKPGASVPIVFRIGSDFEGGTYPFVRELSERFSIVDRTGEHAITTLDGDDPAAEIEFKQAGLAIVIHQRKSEQVEFDIFEKFETSLRYEGLERFVDLHLSSGRPKVGIRDSYSRFAKSLIAVGDGDGDDRAVGLPFELIAEKNPYKVGAAAMLPVRVLHVGAPIADILVKCFNRNDPQSPRTARTDKDGRVAFDVSGSGEYLISAVHMTPPPPTENADWSSLWASLTFARP